MTQKNDDQSSKSYMMDQQEGILESQTPEILSNSHTKDLDFDNL